MFAKSWLCLGAAVWLMSSCGNVADRFRNDYNPRRSVADQGGTNAIATGTACALLERDAEYQAQKAAEYHLRGILGSSARYVIQTQKVRSYREGDKICIEASAIADPK